MKPRETMTWAGPLPPGESDPDIDEMLTDIMTSAGPTSASDWEPEVEQNQAFIWAGPLPPGAIEAASF